MKETFFLVLTGNFYPIIKTVNETELENKGL